MRILVVEDDRELNELITSYLKIAGYEVSSTFNGLDALNIFSERKFDIILSDIMMPLCDGFELAKSIRELDVKIPIIFMSAREDKLSKKLGYRIGIDDYITKPFDLDELVFKINAIARRININNNQLLVIGNFKMDSEEHMAYIDNEELPLTVREFDILYKLLSFPKKTFTRSQLMEEFWDYDSSATSRTVDVTLSKLREKIKGCNNFEILTVHGLGYKAVINEKNN